MFFNQVEIKKKGITEIDWADWFVTGTGLFTLYRMNKRLKVGKMTNYDYVAL